MKATISDIARLAGVSHGCVSRVLRNVPISVSEARRKKILQIAKDLNYTPNRSAQILKSGKHSTLGVIAYDIGDAFAMECITAMEAYLNEHTDYRALWMSCSTRHTQSQNPSRMLYDLAQSVDGVIIISAQQYLSDAQVLRFWADTHLPMVTMVRTIPGETIPSVAIDEKKGIQLIVEHLHELGHQRIGFCYRRGKVNPYATLRFQSFKKWIRHYGLDDDKKLHIPVDGTSNDGYQAGGLLADMKDRPSAIVGFNDLTAYGLIRACYDRGLSIPNEISIAGIDNIRMSEMITPPLTTVAANYNDLARSSLEQMLQQINASKDKLDEMQPVLTEPILMVRKTTGKHVSKDNAV